MSGSGEDSSMVLNAWMFYLSSSIVEIANKGRFHCDGLGAAFDSGRHGTTANGRATPTALSMDSKIHARKKSK